MAPEEVSVFEIDRRYSDMSFQMNDWDVVIVFYTDLSQIQNCPQFYAFYQAN